MDEDLDVPTEMSPYLSPMDKYANNIVTLTSTDGELAHIEMTLRSKRMVSPNKYESVGDPMMNEEGISSVMGTMRSIVNRVTIFSNLDKKVEIPALMDFLADTLAKDLMMNRVKYGIKSFAARDRIYFMVLSTSFITMKRAAEEGLSDKKFWGRTFQEISSKVEMGNKKEGGFLSRLNTWNR